MRQSVRTPIVHFPVLAILSELAESVPSKWKYDVGSLIDFDETAVYWTRLAISLDLTIAAVVACYRNYERCHHQWSNARYMKYYNHIADLTYCQIEIYQKKTFSLLSLL